MNTDKRIQGKWFVSPSPVNIELGFYGRAYKSIKNKDSIDGKIIANAFGGNGDLSKEAIEEAEANAQYIVKAVNNFDNAIDLLKDVLSTIENGYNFTGSQKFKIKQAIEQAEK